jgi:hypothetical protein
MEHTIIYDEDCECYVWWFNGSGMCLSALNETEAAEEVDALIAVGNYPETAILEEGEEAVEYYDVEDLSDLPTFDAPVFDDTH